MKKLLLTFAVCLFAVCAAHAQTAAVRSVVRQQPWWFILEQGKNHFRNGAYGNALMAFEDARRGREQHFARLEEDIIQLLSLPEVRRFGDSLELIEWYITDRNRTEAAAALAELYHRVPRANLDGSAYRILDELDRLKGYPEAEFWLGETYRIESELGLALNQYRKAYDMRELLEIPDFSLEILYQMALLHRLRQEYQEMESRLLEILSVRRPSPTGQANIYWAGEGDGLTTAMMRILENDGINRFLLLYRSDNAVAERAHRLLGIYYYASNRHGIAAEHLMFSFLIQNTLLINEARRLRYDYEYSTLEALILILDRRPDLQEWIEETQYYRTAYYLASALFATGRMLPAGQIWTFLASRSDAGEWQGKAQTQLRSPFIERAVEMP